MMFKTVTWFDRLASTQTYIKQHPELEAGSVIAALFQEAGYGRQGAPWHSDASANLLFSFKVPTTHASAYRWWVSVLIALVELCHEEGIQASIKPPNDLYIGGRKAAGILVETRQELSLMGYVGVGLNVHQTQFETDLNATSLTLETGKTYALKPLLKRLLNKIEKAHTVSLDEARRWYANHLALDGFSIHYEGQQLKPLKRTSDGFVLVEKMRVDPWKLVYEPIDKIKNSSA